MVIPGTKCWHQFSYAISLLIVFRQLSPDWRPIAEQAARCMASSWARVAADIGDANATLILEKQWGCKIPEKIIEAGLLQKARLAHMS